MAGGEGAGLPAAWARRRLSDDQLARTSTVLASPITGPSGSAKPIQKAKSAGNSASANTTPARRRCHNNHPAATSATQTGQNNTSSGTVVSMPMFSNGPAVGREPQEDPDITTLGEVPDRVGAGQAKVEPGDPGEQSRGPDHGRARASNPRRPGPRLPPSRQLSFTVHADDARSAAAVTAGQAGAACSSTSPRPAPSANKNPKASLARTSSRSSTSTPSHASHWSRSSTAPRRRCSHPHVPPLADLAAEHRALHEGGAVPPSRHPRRARPRPAHHRADLTSTTPVPRRPALSRSRSISTPLTRCPGQSGSTPASTRPDTASAAS